MAQLEFFLGSGIAVAFIAILFLLSWFIWSVFWPYQIVSVGFSETNTDFITLYLFGTLSTISGLLTFLGSQIITTIESLAYNIRDNWRLYLIGGAVAITFLGWLEFHPDIIKSYVVARQTIIRPIQDLVVYPIVNIFLLLWDSLIPIWDGFIQIYQFLVFGIWRLTFSCTTNAQWRDMSLKFANVTIAASLDFSNWLLCDPVTCEFDISNTLAKFGIFVESLTDILDCYCNILSDFWDILVFPFTSSFFQIIFNNLWEITIFLFIQWPLQILKAIFGLEVLTILKKDLDLNKELVTISIPSSNITIERIVLKNQFNYKFKNQFSIYSTNNRISFTFVWVKLCEAIKNIGFLVQLIVKLQVEYWIGIAINAGPPPTPPSILVTLTNKNWAGVFTHPTCAFINFVNITSEAFINIDFVLLTPGGKFYTDYTPVFDELRGWATDLASLINLFDFAFSFELSDFLFFTLDCMIRVIEIIPEVFFGSYYQFFFTTPGNPIPFLKSYSIDPNGSYQKLFVCLNLWADSLDTLIDNVNDPTGCIVRALIKVITEIVYFSIKSLVFFSNYVASGFNPGQAYCPNTDTNTTALFNRIDDLGICIYQWIIQYDIPSICTFEPEESFICCLAQFVLQLWRTIFNIIQQIVVFFLDVLTLSFQFAFFTCPATTSTNLNFPSFDKMLNETEISGCKLVCVISNFFFSVECQFSVTIGCSTSSGCLSGLGCAFVKCILLPYKIFDAFWLTIQDLYTDAYANIGSKMTDAIFLFVKEVFGIIKTCYCDLIRNMARVLDCTVCQFVEMNSPNCTDKIFTTFADTVCGLIDALWDVITAAIEEMIICFFFVITSFFNLFNNGCGPFNPNVPQCVTFIMEFIEDFVNDCLQVELFDIVFAFFQLFDINEILQILGLDELFSQIFGALTIVISGIETLCLAIKNAFGALGSALANLAAFPSFCLTIASITFCIPPSPILLTTLLTINPTGPLNIIGNCDDYINIPPFPSFKKRDSVDDSISLNSTIYWKYIVQITYAMLPWNDFSKCSLLMKYYGNSTMEWNNIPVDSQTTIISCIKKRTFAIELKNKASKYFGWLPENFLYDDYALLNRIPNFIDEMKIHYRYSMDKTLPESIFYSDYYFNELKSNNLSTDYIENEDFDYIAYEKNISDYFRDNNINDTKTFEQLSLLVTDFVKGGFSNLFNRLKLATKRTEKQIPIFVDPKENIKNAFSSFQSVIYKIINVGTSFIQLSYEKGLPSKTIEATQQFITLSKAFLEKMHEWYFMPVDETIPTNVNTNTTLSEFNKRMNSTNHKNNMLSLAYLKNITFDFISKELQPRTQLAKRHQDILWSMMKRISIKSSVDSCKTNDTFLCTNCTYLDRFLGTIQEVFTYVSDYYTNSYNQRVLRFTQFLTYTINSTAPVIVGNTTSPVNFPLPGQPVVQYLGLSSTDIGLTNIFNTSNMPNSSLIPGLISINMAAFTNYNPFTSPDINYGIVNFYLGPFAPTIATFFDNVWRYFISRNESNLPGFVSNILNWTVIPGYTRSYTGNQRLLSFGQGLIATSLYVLVFGLIIAVVFVPPFNGYILLLLGLSVPFIFLMITYNWSLTSFPGLPFPLGEDIFNFTVYSLSPKCPYIISGLIVGDNYNNDNCYTTNTLNLEFYSCKYNKSFIDGRDNLGFFLWWLAKDFVTTIDTSVNPYIIYIYDLTIKSHVDKFMDLNLENPTTPQEIQDYQSNVTCVFLTLLPNAIFFFIWLYNIVTLIFWIALLFFIGTTILSLLILFLSYLLWYVLFEMERKFVFSYPSSQKQLI